MAVKPKSMTLLSSMKNGDNTYTIRNFFHRLSEAKQKRVNFAMQICHFLFHIVGQGQVKPAEAKIEAIADFLYLLAKGN